MCVTLILPFYFCDRDIDPMTLIYELALDVLKMYLCTKSEVSVMAFKN